MNGVRTAVAAGILLGAVLGSGLAYAAARLAGRAVAPWTTGAVGALAGGLAVAARPDQPLAAAVGFAVAMALVLLAAVDVAALRLPDLLTLPLLVAGLAAGPVATEPLAARLIGATVGFLSLWAVGWAFRRVRGRSGLGLGDAKLYAAAGAWLGWDRLPQVLLLACAVGLTWAAVRCLLSGRASLSRPIPFGAGLCLGWFVVWATQWS